MSTPNNQGFVNPIGAGATPGRIDMGVDYLGKFNLYAMGEGTITNVYNNGWPGGTFIGLKLDTGQIMYYAENIKPASGLKVGQHVSAGQIVGTAIGTYPYTEIGWAAPPGTGSAMAAQAGEAATGSDPGEKSTAYGVSMSNLISSLGGPAGILTPGGITGSVGAGYPSGASQTSSPQTTDTTGSTIPGCVPMIWVIWLVIMFVGRHLAAVEHIKRPSGNLACGWRCRQSDTRTHIEC